jgi:hypothetical protein
VTLETYLLPENFWLLQNILYYHIVDGSHPAASLVSGNLTTLSGDTVSVVVSDMAISFNNAFVIERDWMFDNGIVHVIDRVLLPPSDPLPAKWTRAFYLAKQDISMNHPFKPTWHGPSLIVSRIGNWIRCNAKYCSTTCLSFSALYHTN